MSNGTAWKTVTLYQSTRDAARAAPLIDAGDAPRHRTADRCAVFEGCAAALDHVDGTALVTTLTRSSEVPQMIENADLPPVLLSRTIVVSHQSSQGSEVAEPGD